MHQEQGVTLVELLAVVAVASVTLVAAVGYSVPWMASQTMRSALHDVYGFMQLARMEAVSRNHACRFVIETSSGSLQVWDTQGTVSSVDDTLLHDQIIPTTVDFARPDSGSVITLQQVATTTYQTVFDSDGTVGSGAGDVLLHGSGSFGRLSIHAAGGAEIRYWNGTTWQAGS